MLSQAPPWFVECYAIFLFCCMCGLIGKPKCCVHLCCFYHLYRLCYVVCVYPYEFGFALAKGKRGQVKLLSISCCCDTRTRTTATPKGRQKESLLGWVPKVLSNCNGKKQLHNSTSIWVKTPTRPEQCWKENVRCLREKNFWRFLVTCE